MTRLTAEYFPVGIEVCDCLTPFGDARAASLALSAGRRGLQLLPVLGDSGDLVPLALLRDMTEKIPPRWLPELHRLFTSLPPGNWGTARQPVVVTSSNFGVGSLYAYLGNNDARHLEHGTPWACVELLQREFGWGENVSIFSHACVSSHLGLAHASRLLHAGVADRVLVFTFDFVSPFVAGGFHSLKILNEAFPAPYEKRDIGSIGLGDGAAFAVLSREKMPFQIEAHALHNEMHHFTANQSDGAGFAICAEAMNEAAKGRRVWVKGHGTGTLEAGRLEAETYARFFPDAPLVSWKGSLGHTLGSCGLVELAIACEAVLANRIPGTIGTSGPCFSANVAVESFSSDAYDGTVLVSNAFGGAHASLLLTHV